MEERRYTDEEVAAIFARASETEPTSLPPSSGEGTGLTLAALQEIGREVGISPEAISHAARSLEVVGVPASRTFLGLPIGVGRTVEFDRPLSDAEWEGLVADCRTTFEARGQVRYDGPFRQWTNGNLQALLEPTAKGHRLRLQTLKGDARVLMIWGSVVLGGGAATWIAAAVGLIPPEMVAQVGFMTLLGGGMLVAGGLQVSAWARRRKMQIEAILARLANSTKTLPPGE